MPAATSLRRSISLPAAHSASATTEPGVAQRDHPALDDAARRGVAAASAALSVLSAARKQMEAAVAEAHASFGGPAAEDAPLKSPPTLQLGPASGAPAETHDAEETPDAEERAVRRAARLGLAARPPDVQAELCLPCDAPRHFTCGVCLETRWRDAASALALGCCDVAYCAACWAGVAAAALESSALPETLCPTTACRRPGRGGVQQAQQAQQRRAELASGLAALAVPRGAAPDVAALRTLLENPRARRCPECRHAQAHAAFEVDLRCEACGAGFCALHDGAHPGVRCADFCAALRAAAGERDPGHARFARRMHTRCCPHCQRSILKDGGCNTMACACGRSFRWSEAEVEVPCACLNLWGTPPHGRSRGRFHLWGLPPCPGASRAAHAKLRAWRCAVLALGSPLWLAVATVALPCLCVQWGVRRAAIHAVARENRRRAERAGGGRLGRGLGQGSFEYNYYVHGDGRAQLPRWLR